MIERNRARLEHMQRYARAAVDIVGTGDAEALERDELKVLALTAALTIVGEASVQLSPELRDRWPHVPWRRIKNLRNVIVHRYFELRIEELVDTVRDHLPGLLHDLDRILAEEPTP